MPPPRPAVDDALTPEREALNRAIDAAGTQEALAAALGIKSPSISGWKRCPAERVLDVERITGVSRHELRRDLYPREEVA